MKRERSPGRLCPALHLPFVAVPVLSCAHWTSRWPGAERGQTGQRNSSSNRFCVWPWRLGAVVEPLSFWATATRAGVVHSGAHAHIGLGTAPRWSRPSAPLPAPWLCAFLPECPGGRFGKTFRHIARCNHCLLYTSDAADEEDSVDLGG